MNTCVSSANNILHFNTKNPAAFTIALRTDGSTSSSVQPGALDVDSFQSSSSFPLLRPASATLCQCLQEFIGFRDLLFHTFGFLNLKDLVHLFRTSNALSTCYLHYRFQPYHELRGGSFLRVLAAYEKLYQRHQGNNDCIPSLTRRPFLHAQLVSLRFQTVVKVNSVDELEKLSRLPFFTVVRALRLGDHVDRQRDLIIGCLPPNLTALTAQYLERELSCGVLPSSLLSIDLGNIKHSIRANVLPDGLTELRLNDYDRPLSTQMLPASLRGLCLELVIYTIPNGLLPSGLEELKIRIKNFPSLEILPVNLRRLSLSVYQPALPTGSFPRSLTSLELIHPCETLTAGYLPLSLRELTLSEYGDAQLLPGVLPHGLEVLRFGDGGVHQFPIEANTFPSSLRSLEIICCPKYPLTANVLPCGLRTLKVATMAVYPLRGVFPPSLEQFELHDRINQMYYNYTDSCFQFLPGDLPSGLRELNISIVVGKLKVSFIAGCLPASLRSLSLFLPANSQFTLQPGVLNEGLDVLVLNDYRGSLSSGILPSSLRSIVFDPRGTSTPNFATNFAAIVWPASLTNVFMHAEYKYSITRSHLPSSLRSVRFRDAYPGDPLQWLPDHLCELFLPDRSDSSACFDWLSDGTRVLNIARQQQLKKLDEEENEQLRQHWPKMRVVRARILDSEWRVK